MPMHDDQVVVDAATVGRLVADQFPQWRELAITSVASDATVNAIFRIGEDHAARFPLRAVDIAQAAPALRAEAEAITELATVCPFPTPRPVAIGSPGFGYPGQWSVQTWLPGTVATPGGVATSEDFAADLAALIGALRASDTGGRRFARSGRGGHLPDHDAWVDKCLRNSTGLVDADRLRGLWGRFRELPRAGADVMSHGDLTPPNLLVAGERLAGVLDGGGFAPAEPALDLVAGWHLLDRGPRSRLRAALGCGEVEWARGAAWALEQALGLIWYYRETNPGMSALGHSTIERILTDSASEGWA